MKIGSEILRYDNLSSTNTKASELLKNQEIPEGTVVHTDYQTAGKGQRGNKWESEKGKNLLISIILYPESVLPEEQFFLSMTISLGITDFLDRYITGSKIKWPNDIYFGNDKIAGILIENTIMGEQTETTVAGIGLNINQENFRGTIINPVSLKMITGESYNTDICMKQLLESLDLRYKQLLFGDRTLLRTDYISRLYRYNEWYSYKKEEDVFTGRICDVLPTGILTIEEKNGRRHNFSFKEVEYII
jgi:BirA family biotin operon repressor/biotin-[acetyl-CoA-carboxylase] ligase